MELKYPFVLLIGIPLVIILYFIKIKRKGTFLDGKKIANTSYVKDTDYYKKLMLKYKIFNILIEASFIIAMIVSLVLISRPQKVEKYSPNAFNRDIMLCLDSSTSCAEQNMEIVDTLKQIVNNLQGERFGITIFNTTPTTVCPLTDDYTYVLDCLDSLKNGFGIYAGEYGLDDFELYEYSYYSSYVMDGTLVNNETRGSSLIGDGLASAVYSLRKEELEDRSQFIIFATDNDLNGDEIYTLDEACQYAKKNNITLFGIGENSLYATKTGLEEMEQAITRNGGKYYSDKNGTSIKRIVQEIESSSKSIMGGQELVRRLDVPQTYFVILLIDLTVLVCISKKVSLW